MTAGKSRLAHFASVSDVFLCRIAEDTHLQWFGKGAYWCFLSWCVLLAMCHVLDSGGVALEVALSINSHVHL